MCAQKRIALYGGTFDPVHVGHVEIARRVSELFEIDRVIFIPAQMAPHKIGRPVTEPIHRYAMLALATQDDPRFFVSTFELDDPDRRYTVDTVEHFQRELGDSTELFFIMGADSWSEITTWREWERLLTITNHIVVTRPGYEPRTAHVGAHAARVHFTDVVMTKDFVPLEPKILEHKFYARGVGPVLVLDVSGAAGREELISHETGA